MNTYNVDGREYHTVREPALVGDEDGHTKFSCECLCVDKGFFEVVGVVWQFPTEDVSNAMTNGDLSNLPWEDDTYIVTTPSAGIPDDLMAMYDEHLKNR